MSVVPPAVWSFVVQHEEPPVSRWRFGSPCRFVRALDLFVHVIVPLYLSPRLPRVATYLRRTSPRWGRAWRAW